MQSRIIDIIGEEVNKVVDNVLLAQPKVEIDWLGRDHDGKEEPMSEGVKRECMMRFIINMIKWEFGSPFDVVEVEDLHKFLVWDVVSQYRDYMSDWLCVAETRRDCVPRCRKIRTFDPYGELVLYSIFVEAEKEWLKAIQEFEVAENKLRSTKEGKEWFDAEFKEDKARERYNILKEILMYRGVIDGDRIRCINFGQRCHRNVWGDMDKKELDKDGLPLSMCKDISFSEGRVKLTIKRETFDERWALVDEFILAKDHYEKVQDVTLDMIAKMASIPEYEQYAIALNGLVGATRKYDDLWFEVLCKWRGSYVEDN